MDSKRYEILSLVTSIDVESEIDAHTKKTRELEKSLEKWKVTT